MATNNLVTPITSNVNAFDAIKEHTFYFTISGGSQVVKNEILIVTNDDDRTVVHNNIMETYQLYQSVPSNTLINGEQYLVSFRVYDAIGNVSEYSQEVPFYCLTTPTLTLNISNGDIVNNSYFDFDCIYNQIQDELMDYMYFNIYNASNVLIDKSPNIYNSDFPPLVCSYRYNGFESDSIYKVNVVCVTVNGMVITSDVVNFTVIYGSSKMFSLLTLDNKCNDGYISITSKLITIDGNSNPSPPIYVNDDTMIECVSCTNKIDSEYNHNVSWNEGFNIEPNTFLIRAWIYPSQFNNDTTSENKIMNFKGINGDTLFGVYLCRKGNLDYIIVSNDDGLYVHSNGISNVTEYEKCLVWIKYSLGQWEIIFENISDTQTSAILEWNGDSNIEYNFVANGLLYEDESMDTFNFNRTNQKAINEPIYDVKLSNGIYDHINITSDINIPYSTDIPNWDFNTILDCNFEGNIYGGNLDVTSSQISGIRLKKKDASSSWYTIYETYFDTDHTSISTIDTCAPNGIKQEYALVPMLVGDIEGNYIIKDITPKWNGVFISDGKGNIFKLYNAINYNSTSTNTPNGILTPIGRKYPVVIRNSDIDYQSGGISANLLGYTFEKTRRIDRNDIVKETNDFINFLNNGESKIIKDWNGNIFIVKIVGKPSISYSQSYGNGVTNVSFEWVEQGKYNDYLDLYSNGLI